MRNPAFQVNTVVCPKLGVSHKRSENEVFAGSGGDDVWIDERAWVFRWAVQIGKADDARETDKRIGSVLCGFCG